jgi:hypothetical protein
MESSHTSYRIRKDPSTVAVAGRNVLGLLWQVIRIPVLSVLVLLEPVVCFVLAALAILSVIAAMFWKLSGTVPAFPLWGMLAFSAGSIALLAIYYALIRLFTRP